MLAKLCHSINTFAWQCDGNEKKTFSIVTVRIIKTTIPSNLNQTQTIALQFIPLTYGSFAFDISVFTGSIFKQATTFALFGTLFIFHIIIQVYETRLLHSINFIKFSVISIYKYFFHSNQHRTCTHKYLQSEQPMNFCGKIKAAQCIHQVLGVLPFAMFFLCTYIGKTSNEKHFIVCVCVCVFFFKT
jgi:hypothetical protein